eukprot:jgi/Phyca11/120103/e_gw1.40.437.1
MLFATLVYYYKMVLLTEMTTEASLFNTLYAEYATPQMMDSIRYRKLVYFHRMGLLNDRFFREFPGVSRTREFIRHVEPFALGSCHLYQVCRALPHAMSKTEHSP